MTGERIRDKIAGLEAQGHVDGGLIPLGYDRLDRRLMISPSEAEMGTIYRQYMELSSVRLLRKDLE